MYILSEQNSILVLLISKNQCLTKSNAIIDTKFIKIELI